MSERLATWLTEQSTVLLPQWVQGIREHGVSDERWDAAALHEQFFVPLFAALCRAAAGDLEALLPPLQQLETMLPRRDRTLPQLLDVPSHLRRIVWQQVVAIEEPAAALHLLGELETLTDWMTGVLGRMFTADAERALQTRISEAEFMTVQLAVATEESDRAAVRTARLYQFAQRINHNLLLPELLATVGQQIQSALQAQRCAIWLLHDGMLVNVHNVGYDAALHNLRYAIDTPGLLSQAFQHLKPWLLQPPHGVQDGGWVDVDQALLALPLIASDKHLGVIVLQAPAEQLTNEQVALAQSFASQTALALENARLYDQIVQLNAQLEDRIRERTAELSAERDRLDLLFRISIAVSSTLDSDEMLRQTLQILAERIGVSHGSVLLLDPETRQLVRRTSLTPGSEENTRFPLGIGVAGWVAETAAPVMIDDVRKDPRWLKPVGSSRHLKQRGSLIIVPLVINDDVIGVLQLSHHKVNFFNDDHLRLLTTVANEIAVAVRNADLFHTVSNQTTRLQSILARERMNSSQSQAILQSLSDGVVVFDRQGQVLSANAASARILDIPLEALIINNLTDILRQLRVTNLERVPIRNLMEHPFTEDGQPRIFRSQIDIGASALNATIGPVVSEDGEVLGGVAILRDISRELASDRMKTEFIGTVSHELRTPMTVIKGYVQLMSLGSLGELTPLQREVLGTIRNNAERMTTIINDLIDITKIESGSVELELARLRVLDVISGAVSRQQTALTTRQHRLRIDVSPALADVRADRGRLEQVLDHLLSNAIKYTLPAGDIVVSAAPCEPAHLSLERREQLHINRAYVMVTVSDTGIGIANADKDHIFDRFYRADSSLKVEAGGTGLGLSIVRPLVRLMNGFIWVDSQIDSGSTFTVTLPTA